MHNPSDHSSSDCASYPYFWSLLKVSHRFCSFWYSLCVLVRLNQSICLMLDGLYEFFSSFAQNLTFPSQPSLHQILTLI